MQGGKYSETLSVSHTDEAGTTTLQKGGSAVYEKRADDPDTNF
jgi:hypothetical protein